MTRVSCVQMWDQSDGNSPIPTTLPLFSVGLMTFCAGKTLPLRGAFFPSSEPAQLALGIASLKPIGSFTA